MVVVRPKLRRRVHRINRRFNLKLRNWLFVERKIGVDEPPERGYSGNGQTASDVLERALAKLDFQKCGDERGSRWSEAVTQYEDGLKEEVKRRRSLEK